MSGVWLGVFFILTALWLPIGVAAWAFRKACSVKSRPWRWLCVAVYVLAMAWVLGWIGQYLYRTHIWYSWAAQPETVLR